MTARFDLELESKIMQSYVVSCAVPNCKHTSCSLQPFYGNTHSPYVGLESDWFLQRQGYITRHMRVLVTQTFVLCPAHSEVWKDYRQKLDDWDKECAAARKKSWLSRIIAKLTLAESDISKTPPKIDWNLSLT